MDVEICLDQTRVRAWVAARMPAPQNREITPRDLLSMKGIGYTLGDQLVAGFLFTNHLKRYRSVEVHVALERPNGSNGALFRGIFRNVALYPFTQLKCRRISAYVPRKQKKIRQILKVCGFKEEGTMRLAFGEDHAVIYGLLRHEAPAWLYE